MRLFAAITMPTEIRERLLRAITELRPVSRAPRWVNPDGLHLTLKFFGDADPAQLPTIVSALQSVHAPHATTLRIHGLGYFPNSLQPRVIWAGITAGPELQTLATEIQSRVGPLGFPAEERDFSPHITLARINTRERSPAPEPTDNLVRAAAAFASYDFGTMHASEFHLFRSTLKSTGAEYSKLATFRLSTNSQPEPHA
jgi:RNA 2',3'-cyclic 3'-phosphodiesterase